MAEKEDKVILFFEKYSEKGRKLHESFKVAGCEYPVLVVEEDGFLPDGVESIYGFYLDDSKFQPGVKAKPKHKEDISLEQEFQENHLTGRVIMLDRDREELLYGWPVWPQIVKAVDWLDKNNVIRISEHYNRYGKIGRASCRERVS